MGLTERARLVAATAGLLRSQWWSRERIRAYQGERLVAQLRHAAARVPFYRDLGLDSPAIRAVRDLERFPVVTKADVRGAGRRFLDDAVEPERLFQSRSSGTTGEPAVTYFDAGSWLLTKHALKARRVLADVKRPGQRVLVLSELRYAAERPSLLGALAKPLVSLRGLSLLDDIGANLGAFIEFRPTMVYGFPSYLLALAEAARERGTVLPRVPLVYTSSETLTAEVRKSLESAYRGRVADVYGCTEFKEIAVQCPHGRYHVNFESVYLESVADGEGGPPRLLVTTLVNKAMPLIRYTLGDAGRLVDEDCPCGRQSPQIVELHGKLAEGLVFPDGTRVALSKLLAVLDAQLSVRDFRIVHEEPERLSIALLARPPLAEPARRALETEIRGLLPVGVAVRLVELAARP